MYGPSRPHSASSSSRSPAKLPSSSESAPTQTRDNETEGTPLHLRIAEQLGPGTNVERAHAATRWNTTYLPEYGIVQSEGTPASADLYKAVISLPGILLGPARTPRYADPTISRAPLMEVHQHILALKPRDLSLKAYMLIHDRYKLRLPRANLQTEEGNQWALGLRKELKAHCGRMKSPGSTSSAPAVPSKSGSDGEEILYTSEQVMRHLPLLPVLLRPSGQPCSPPSIQEILQMAPSLQGVYELMNRHRPGSDLTGTPTLRTTLASMIRNLHGNPKTRDEAARMQEYLDLGYPQTQLAPDAQPLGSRGKRRREAPSEPAPADSAHSPQVRRAKSMPLGAIKQEQPSNRLPAATNTHQAAPAESLLADDSDAGQ